MRIKDSKYTRRLTALYPEVPLTGPASSLVRVGVGTLGNCSGGRTPWMTALSCEENYPDYTLHKDQPESARNSHRWNDVPEMAIDEKQYGWVVEVDPFGELPPRKHSSLGRFVHENAAWTLGPTNRLVVYMGEDRADQVLYKFVSAGAYDPKATRAGKNDLLTEGTLYAADLVRGKRLPLDVKRDKRLAEEYESQAALLMACPAAARLAGASPLDRPED